MYYLNACHACTFMLLFVKSYCQFIRYFESTEYEFVSYDGTNIEVAAEDIIKEFKNVHESDCLHMCKKRQGICNSINIKSNNERNKVNCKILKTKERPIQRISKDKYKKFVLLQKKPKRPRVSKQLELRICGECEEISFVESKTPFTCDCRKVQQPNLSSCQIALSTYATKSISVFVLTMKNGATFKAFCEPDSKGTGWLTFMYRSQNSIIDKYGMENYKNGFGSFANFYWLGLNYLYDVTSEEEQTMKIEYVTSDKQTMTYTYDGFSLRDNETYKMYYKNFSSGDNCEENNNIVVLQSKNFPTYSIGVKKSGEGEVVWILEAEKLPLAQNKFEEVKGLVHENTEVKEKIQTEKIVSFKLGNNSYLKHSGFNLYLHEQPVNNAAEFNEHASFVIREQEGSYKGYIRFESYNFPGYFISHGNYRVKIEKERSDDSFLENSSFLKISYNQSSCPELQCRDSNKWISKADLCGKNLDPKCDNLDDVELCGPREATSVTGNAVGTKTYIGNLKFPDCLRRCSLKWINGEKEITNITWRTDNHCYCIKSMTSFRKEQSVTCNFLNGCSFNIGHGNPTINNVIMDEEINSASECKGACVSYSKNNNFNLKMISYDKELLQCRCFDAVKRLLFRVVDIFKVKVKCSSGELFCDGKCISSDKICDGIPDCSKEIDEKLCRKALLDNMKCYYDQDFQSCPNKGFWWNKCEDNLKRKNVPTIPGSIHWNHDNIRSFKISLTKSRLNKTRVETCKDVFDQTHCLHTTRTVINPDGRGDIWVKCYFKHYFDRRQVYAVIFYRHQNLRETITTSDIINGTDFQRQFIWIGLENFAKLFYNKPRDLLVSRKGLGGVYYESILTNFQCTRDGKKVFFDAEKAGHASSREIGVFMQNTTFQFCNDSVQPYWWWGCRKIQPLYEKYTDETFVYISGHKSTHLWLSVIDDV